MSNYLTILNELDKVKKWPWKGCFVAIAMGFLISSAISVFIGYAFFPEHLSLGKTVTDKAHTDVQKFDPSLGKVEIDEILDRNLFNKDSKGEELPEEEVIKEEVELTGNYAVKSQLPMTLKGTIFSGDPLSGIALVENNSEKTQNSFFVGDQLAPGAKVIEIYRERIIIDRGDKKEYLEIEKKDLKNDRKKGKGKAKAVVSRYAVEPPPDSWKEEGFERQGNSIQMSSDFRKKLLTSDFSKVLQDAKAEPYFVDGELGGFRLTRIKQDSIYQKAGFNNGDVIKEINGVSLVDTAQAIKLLNSLRGESDLEVRLDRGGQNININLNIR